MTQRSVQPGSDPLAVTPTPSPTEHPQAEGVPPEYLPSEHPPSEHPPSARRTPVAVKVVVALLCGLLGFALAIQVRRTVNGDALSTARPDDLVALLDGLQHREDELTSEIGDLQATLARLRTSGASSAEALAEAERQADALGILTGTVAAHGPGVRIVIADPKGTVPPEVLLDAIQELRNAGAEAFQVNPVRIGVDSAFTGIPGKVVLDGTALSAPYVVLAIGDPPTLSAALAIPGGVTDTVRRAGGTITVTQSDNILVSALRPPRKPIYARPAG
jgi:uncharacterized protein YlxW (UPF0749 family)